MCDWGGWRAGGGGINVLLSYESQHIAFASYNCIFYECAIKCDDKIASHDNKRINI